MVQSPKNTFMLGMRILNIQEVQDIIQTEMEPTIKGDHINRTKAPYHSLDQQWSQDFI